MASSIWPELHHPVNDDAYIVRADIKGSWRSERLNVKMGNSTTLRGQEATHPRFGKGYKMYI